MSNSNEKTLTLPKRHRKASLDAKKARAGYLFVLPFLIGILFVYLPILIDSITYSFSNFLIEINEQGTPERVLEFVGFDHYNYAFTTSPDFVGKLVSGLQNLIFEVPAIIIFSLFIAVVLNQKMLGRAAFRAIFFVPVIIATGIMESLGDNMATQATQSSVEAGGAAAESATQTGGAEQTGGAQIISMLDVQALFANMKVGQELVTYVVDLVNNIYNIINYSGVQMLIFLAGLQSISPQIYEACKIDGATGWETFWKVTFPMISPMILVNAVYTVIDSFTRTSNVTMTYISGEVGRNLGQGSAMYWIYFLSVILIIALVGAIMSSFIFYQRRD